MAMIMVLAALAAVLLAAGLLLWQVSHSGAQRAAGTAFIDSRIAKAPEASKNQSKQQVATRKAAAFFSLDELFLRAGVVPTTSYYLRTALIILGVSFAAFVIGGWLAAAIGCLAALVGVYFRLWWVATRRQQRMVSQLPGFLDAVVRLITIGSSIGAAFQTAAISTEQPLREVVERVAGQNRSGKELDQALANSARLYGLKELQLVSAVIAVALRYGGRSDQVLERMAHFIRDIEQARQELTALSAEVRLSAWILSLLPIGIAAYIVVFNTQMFLGMWNDPAGVKMLMVAVVLQLTGSFWLYRMAKSV